MKHRRKTKENMASSEMALPLPAPGSQPKPLFIVGAGVFLHDLIALARTCPEFEIAGILDPSPALKGQNIKGLPVRGWLGDLPEGKIAAVVGTPSAPGAFDREAVFQILLKHGVDLPILRSRASRPAPDVVLRRATILLPESIVKSGASIGENCLLAPMSIIGEGINLPAHTVVMPEQKLLNSHQQKRPKIQPKSLSATLSSKHESIQEIIRMINWAAMEIMLVTDENGALVGTITDGDIRRGILAGIDIRQPVSTIMNPHPITVPLGTSHGEMLELMQTHSIRHLPVVDNNKRPVRLEMMTTVLDNLKAQGAIIMAGGLGTRLRPLTSTTPKPLLSVAGKPVLDHILANIRANGLEDIIISVNYMGQQIKKHVGDGRAYNLNVNYLSEQKKMGTAGALSLLRPRPRRPFLVINGDLMTNMNFSKLLKFQRDHKYNIVMCVYKQKFNVPYGVVEIDNGSVTGIREKPVYEHFINASIYTLEPACIDLVPYNEFFDMPDLINKVLANGGTVGAFPIIEYWRDIGTSRDLTLANMEYHQLEQNNIKVERPSYEMAK